MNSHIRKIVCFILSVILTCPITSLGTTHLAPPGTIDTSITLTQSFDIFTKLHMLRDAQYGVVFTPPRKGRGIDVETRKKQIKAIITFFGGALTDKEIAQSLGITVEYLRNWCIKPEVKLNLEELGVIRAKKGEKKHKKKYIKDEALCKLYIYQLMLIHKGLLTLTTRNTFLNKKKSLIGLSKEDTQELELITLGLEFIKKRLKKIKIKDPIYSLSTTGNINYRERAREKIQTALSMLEQNKKPAANAALASCLVKCLGEELKILGKKRRKVPKERFVHIKPTKIKGKRKYKLYQGRPEHVLVEDGVITLVIYQDTLYDLRWDVIQAIDHIIDSEINEIASINDYLSCVYNIQRKIDKAKRGWSPLTIIQKQTFIEEIGGIIAELKPKWIIEKEFAKTALILAKGLIETNIECSTKELVSLGLKETELLGNAQELLGMAQGFFERRKTECEHILEGIEYGNRKAIRDSIREQNEEISEGIEQIYDNLQNKQYDEARKWALGLSQRYDINHEPEFKGLKQRFGWIASELKKGPQADKESIETTIKHVRTHMYGIWNNNLFMVNYREFYKNERIEKGQPPECRESVFKDVYKRFKKTYLFVLHSPHLKIWAMQAALPVNLKIKNPYDPEKKMPNPAFKLISQAALIQYFRSLPNIIKSPFCLTKKNYPNTRATLTRFIRQDKISLHMLNSKHREEIINSLIKDIYLLLLPQDKKLAKQQKREIINKVLKDFLDPDLYDCIEISDEVLIKIRDNANQIKNILETRTEQSIKDALRLNRESLHFFSHLKEPGSPETIYQKLKNIDIYLSEQKKDVLNASKTAHVLVIQTNSILLDRKKGEKPFVKTNKQKITHRKEAVTSL